MEGDDEGYEGIYWALGVVPWFLILQCGGHVANEPLGWNGQAVHVTDHIWSLQLLVSDRSDTTNGSWVDDTVGRIVLEPTFQYNAPATFRGEAFVILPDGCSKAGLHHV